MGVAALEGLLPEADEVKGNVLPSSSFLLLDFFREERRFTDDIFPSCWVWVFDSKCGKCCNEWKFGYYITRDCL